MCNSGLSRLVVLCVGCVAMVPAISPMRVWAGDEAVSGGVGGGGP
jgi:hypothetical protein